MTYRSNPMLSKFCRSVTYWTNPELCRLDQSVAYGTKLVLCTLDQFPNNGTKPVFCNQSVIYENQNSGLYILPVFNHGRNPVLYKFYQSGAYGTNLLLSKFSSPWHMEPTRYSKHLTGLWPMESTRYSVKICTSLLPMEPTGYSVNFTHLNQTNEL